MWEILRKNRILFEQTEEEEAWEPVNQESESVEDVLLKLM